MRTAVLAIIASVFAFACATTSHRGPGADLHYTIDEDFLRFEHDGAMYVVTDPATVEQATSAAKDLFFSSMGAVRGYGEVPAGRRWPPYLGTTSSVSNAAIQDPSASVRESTEASTNLMRLPWDFSSAEYEAEKKAHRWSFEKDAAHAAKRLQKIFERCVRSGLAQRVG
jgi:hypothetical protein